LGQEKAVERVQELTEIPKYQCGSSSTTSENTNASKENPEDDPKEK